MTGPRMDKGAYGLVLGDEFPRDLLTDAGPDWQPWTFEAVQIDVPHGRDDDDFFITGDYARLPYQEGGYVEIDRVTSTTRVFLGHVPSAHEMVHPTPVGTAALHAWWTGSQALHGTAVGRDDQAIAFLGDREHGKSTTSMRLVRDGWKLVADDLLVVRGDRVLSGPRSLDLREASADALGAGTYIGRVGLRDRWRESVAPSPPEHRLAGLVLLEWGAELAVTRLDLPARLEALARHRTVPMLPPLDTNAVLATLAVPVVRLVRPRGLHHLDTTIDAVWTALRLSEWRSAPAGPPAR